jgi:gas vesicle protein
MAIPYEVLVRGKDNGSYSGAHVIDVAGGKARPVKPGDWPALLGVLNDAAIARVSEVEAEMDALKKELDDLKQTATRAAQAVISVIENKDVNDADTIITVKGIARTAIKSVEERELMEAEQAAAEAMAKLELLRSKT